MPLFADKYGRSFSTLRVSLLHHCNLGCVYCVAGDAGTKQTDAIQQTSPTGQANRSEKREALSPQQLLEMIGRLHAQLQLDTIRLTGGEPLLYPGLAGLITGITGLGIPRIKMTTNGFLLERLAPVLKTAGLQSINVSLDALDEDVFFRISRRHNADRITRGIDAALTAGLSVKINTVVMRGINDSQLLPLTEFAFSRGIPIRFLEIMAMGHLHDRADHYLVTEAEILDRLSSRYPLTPVDRLASATARYWQTAEGQTIGIIANESHPFCADCNRLRLDSDGNIYGCLSSNHPIPLSLEEDEAGWGSKLEMALAQKQTIRFTGSDLSMLHIGG